MNKSQATIGRQLAVIQGIAALSLVVVASGGLWGLSKLNTALSTGAIQSSNEALRNVMTADMMHDALRADVLNALLTASVKNQNGVATVEEIQKDLDEHASTFEEMLTATAKLDLPQEIKTAQNNVEPALKEYVESARGIVSMAATTPDKAFEGLPKFMEAFSALETQNEKWSELIETTANSAQADALSLSSHSMTVIVCAFLLALLGGSASAFSIARSMKKRLLEVENELRETSTSTRRSGDDVQRISQNVFEASTEQAAAVQETVASMAEISSMIAQTNDNAKRSLEKAALVAEKSEEGTVTMNRMVESMQSVQQANAQLFEIVNIIDQISAKAQVINDIVFKTQLLSFNASIEAARAGQHGRGFAVVAEEVGKLAEMSGNSATEIQGLLDRSQKHVSQIVESIKHRVSEGQTVSVQAVSTFTEIAEGVRQIATQMRTVDEAVREQEAGIQQVSVAMGQMDTTAQRNSGYAKESAQATERLRQQSQRLVRDIQTLRAMVHGDEGLSDEGAPSRSLDHGKKKKSAERSIRGATRSVSELIDELANHGGASTGDSDFESPAERESDSFVSYN